MRLSQLKSNWLIPPTEWSKHIKLLKNIIPSNIYELFWDDIPYGCHLTYHPEVGYNILIENNGKLMLYWSE